MVANIANTTDYTVIDFLFKAGNHTDNSFISSNLVGDIIIDTWDEQNSCVYTSGDYVPGCFNNCSITSNINIDVGYNISLLGSGIFQVNDGVRISDWMYLRSENSCRIITFGDGGFF